MTVQANSAAAPFAREAHGKPGLPLDAQSIFSFGTLIRESERALLRLFSEGLLSGTTHTCIGQELCQMSVVRALDDPDDIVLSNHRNHGHFLTYSGDFFGLIAEVMGRDGGVCGGIGGSQHLASRNFHSNGVQGGMTAIAAGHGLACRLRGSRGIVAVIIGDGTLGQGLVYESLNLASVWEAPVLFVVENNGIAQTTSTCYTTGGDIPLRGQAFGLHTWRFDDADPEFLGKVQNVVDHVRESREPGFLVIDAQRMGPHSKGDDLRDAAEMEAIRERDPLRRLGLSLPVDVREEIETEARAYIQSVCEAANASPPASRLQARRSIFSMPVDAPEHRVAAPSGNVRSSINASLRHLLAEQSDVILLGEDLHDPYGGAFKVTAGLSTEFPGRVVSTPISEAGVVGAAIGMALHGYRPIVEVMFADFLTLALDQIFNHAVKFPGMFEEARVPLVIRTPSGGRRGYGPTHSQSPENLLSGVPGLTVVFPSARHNPGELLEAAVLRWPYPTVFFEHKLLYGEAVDRAGYRIVEAAEEDAAANLFPTLVRGPEHPDITLVTYGGMVQIVESVAAELISEELEVEVIIPSLLAPMCRATLTRLLAGRERIVAVEESTAGCGFASELGAALMEAGYRGRYARVSAPPVPVPAARSLEEQVVPDAAAIMQAVLRVLDLE